MHIASILKPEAVKVVAEVSSKKRLIQAIAEVATHITDVPANDISAALLDRENLGPTGFGRGVALPHSRLEGLTGVKGVFLKLGTPIEFGSVDQRPVDLVFALFAPEDAGTQHLKALAIVTRLLRNTDLCDELRSSTDAGEIYKLLADARISQAA